jgi:Tfp pilus assembly protein PilZ
MTDRKWPRMALGLGLDLRYQNAKDASHAQTANISREGLFISMDAPRSIGTRVFLRIQVVEPPQTFELEGVVVHANPDPDDPGHVRKGPEGIGVLLTKASEGWTEFCALLEKRHS